MCMLINGQSPADLNLMAATALAPMAVISLHIKDLFEILVDSVDQEQLAIS